MARQLITFRVPDLTPADFAAVRAASERWMRAWVDQDVAALDAFLAPDFTLIIGNAPAACVSRAEWLAMIPRYVCTRFAYHEVQCRALDDLVMMSAIADFDATVDDADRSGRFFVTDAWRRTGEGWQVAARYSTRAEPAGEASLERMFRESLTPRPSSAGIFPSDAGADHRLADIPPADRHIPQQPPISVTVAVDGGHRHRARIEQGAQRLGRMVAQLRFMGAAGRMRLGRVDPGDPHLGSADVEGVAVDDAVHAPAPFAGAKSDPLAATSIGWARRSGRRLSLFRPRNPLRISGVCIEHRRGVRRNNRTRHFRRDDLPRPKHLVHADRHSHARCSKQNEPGFRAGGHPPVRSRLPPIGLGAGPAPCAELHDIAYWRFPGLAHRRPSLGRAG